MGFLKVPSRDHRGYVCPACAWRARHPNQCSGHLSQCITPEHHSLLQPRLSNPCCLGGPRVGGMASSHCPLGGPQHGDKKWEKGGTTGENWGKTLPGAPGALMYSHSAPRDQCWWAGRASGMGKGLGKWGAGGGGVRVARMTPSNRWQHMAEKRETEDQEEVRQSQCPTAGRMSVRDDVVWISQRRAPPPSPPLVSSEQ